MLHKRLDCNGLSGLNLFRLGVPIAAVSANGPIEATASIHVQLIGPRNGRLWDGNSTVSLISCVYASDDLYVAVNVVGRHSDAVCRHIRRRVGQRSG